MNNLLTLCGPCGIEVSQLHLGGELRAHDYDEPLCEFPNTREGHQAVLRFLERSARPVRVALESTGLYGLDLALALHQAGVAVVGAHPPALRPFSPPPLPPHHEQQPPPAPLPHHPPPLPLQPCRPP